jgi:hypothetical protein
MGIQERRLDVRYFIYVEGEGICTANNEQDACDIINRFLYREYTLDDITVIRGEQLTCSLQVSLEKGE